MGPKRSKFKQKSAGCFSLILFISFSSENFNNSENFFFFSRALYQLFLFFLRFFLGFGRHIGFVGGGGILAAVILSLRACLQDENQ